MVLRGVGTQLLILFAGVVVVVLGDCYHDPSPVGQVCEGEGGGGGGGGRGGGGGGGGEEGRC